MNVGILGVGTYLPSESRTNDWWPEDTVEKWRKITPRLLPDERYPAKTDGQRAVLAAIGEYRHDPFYGAVQRHIAPDDMMPSDMEVLAARDALEKTGIQAAQVDIILSASVVPDHLMTPNACAVHRKLGLPRRCFATNIDAACNGFGLQVTLAEQMIRGGQATYALLVQSILGPRMIPAESPSAAWFGDGATAVILGPTNKGRGILSRTTLTDGTTHDAIVAGVPGQRWYEEGRSWWYSRDIGLAKQVILNVADYGREAVNAALEKAGIPADEISYYASHQATAWFTRATQDFIGLKKARSLSTFQKAGNLSACNVPLALAEGEKNGLLKPGDMVATYGGGSGMTWSSLIMRWGN
jgi:3-oxoacyl-[acyl-carrier-protein] synthase III